MQCCDLFQDEGMWRSPSAHVQVVHALSESQKGSIHCSNLPDNVTCKWFNAGDPLDEVYISDNGRMASSLDPGIYELRVTPQTEGNEQPYSIVVAVEGPTHVIIRAYDVTDATAQYARDGSVTVDILNAPTGTKYLWTSGIVTDSPTLQDVRPGMYAAIPIVYGAPVPVIHDTAPAVVSVTRG